MGDCVKLHLELIRKLRPFTSCLGITRIGSQAKTPNILPRQASLHNEIGQTFDLSGSRLSGQEVFESYHSSLFAFSTWPQASARLFPLPKAVVPSQLQSLASILSSPEPRTLISSVPDTQCQNTSAEGCIGKMVRWEWVRPRGENGHTRLDKSTMINCVPSTRRTVYVDTPPPLCLAPGRFRLFSLVGTAPSESHIGKPTPAGPSFGQD
ncbi:unnamed protein product [Protopolystoma xenopodis]|uniref:Uncharacterized protein n=1 Tax=Protopolystoma xenopodis TaxID=117903 RepID=A0A448WNF5_9PLAT|nr:unnamed protein product [Protopolystoma xenopodis]